MLIEEKMKELEQSKEYTKVFNYFHDEYTKMLKNMRVMLFYLLFYLQ